MQRRMCVLAVVVLSIAGWRLARADKGRDRRPQQQPVQAALFEASLVRAAELTANPMLGPFAALGADMLAEGRVEVRPGGFAQVRVRGATSGGAAITDSFTVLFCRLGLPANIGCLNLGQLAVRNGNGEAQFQFVGTEMTLGGVFVLTRGSTTQFVSGFRIVPAPLVPPQAVEIELRGTISAVGSNFFQLQGLVANGVPINITFDSSTRFQGLNAPAIGLEVEVRGFAMPNGTIQATRVRHRGLGAQASDQDEDDDDDGGEGHNDGDH